ncbi:unnamed protein product [Urochloa decumbens]|uniref:Uncharacterized protein n=1 Tax=Urochloa decumbens TaxID=240449 RepID=A0ABC9BCS3_9POAL
MAAAAAAGIPSPPASLPRRCLALAGSAAAVFLWLASMWLAFAAAAATEIGRVACGGGCPLVAAASNVSSAALVSLLLVAPVATLLFAFRSVNSGKKAEKKVPAPETESIAEVIAEVMREMLQSLVSWVQMQCIALSSSPLLLNYGGRNNR